MRGYGLRGYVSWCNIVVQKYVNTWSFYEICDTHIMLLLLTLIPCVSLTNFMVNKIIEM